MDDKTFLIERYGETFHLSPPASAKEISFEQTLFLRDVDVQGDYTICQIKLQKRQAVVLHEYGLTGAFVFPSLRFVGMEQVVLNDSALNGYLQWNIYNDDHPHYSFVGQDREGVKRGGFSQIKMFRVGAGGVPLLFIANNKVSIQIDITQALADIVPPDGLLVTGFLYGYTLDL